MNLCTNIVLDWLAKVSLKPPKSLACKKLDHSCTALTSISTSRLQYSSPSFSSCHPLGISNLGRPTNLPIFSSLVRHIFKVSNILMVHLSLVNFSMVGGFSMIAVSSFQPCLSK